MHYQPLLDLRSGTVSKAEALARLRDGERLLAPGTFPPALSPEDFLNCMPAACAALAQRRHWLRHGFDSTCRSTCRSADSATAATSRPPGNC